MDLYLKLQLLVGVDYSSKRALNKETLQCMVNDKTVSFKQKGTFNNWTYTVDEFHDNGLFAVIIPRL